MKRVKRCPHRVLMIGWGWANHRKVCGRLLAVGDRLPRTRTYPGRMA